MALLETPEFYFPEALTDDGLVGGYSRRSSFEAPFDLPVTWDRSGTPSQLPMLGAFANGYVNGFLPDETPVGSSNRVGQSLSPGYWSSTGFTYLPDVGFGGQVVSGTNEYYFGQVAFDPSGIGFNAALWDRDTEQLQIISGLQGVQSFAWDTNANGVYYGITLDRSNPNDFTFGSFIGRNGAAQRVNFPGFTETRGFEINDDGWITGVWEPAFATQRGYLARINLDTGEQEIHDLGLYPGYDETWAYAINNDRTIVGGAQRLGGDFDLALIWPEGSLTPMDLNPMVLNLPAGVKLIDAYRINNAGQILAEGRGPDGFSYYRLDPVPEPAAIGVMTLMLTGWLNRPHRRRGR